MTSTTYRVFAISLRKQRKSNWKKTDWIFQHHSSPFFFFFFTLSRQRSEAHVWLCWSHRAGWSHRDHTRLKSVFLINNDIRLPGERKLENKLHLHLFSLHFEFTWFLIVFFFIYFVIYLSTSEWTGISKPKWGLHSRLCHRRAEIFSNRHATRQAHPGTEEAARSTNCHCSGW